MDGMLAKQSRKEVEWRQRLARFAASAQQIEGFCQAKSVSEATFYRWRKELATNDVAASAAGFIDVGMMPSSPAVPPKTQCDSAGATLEVRLDLGHGLVLQIVKR
jgi:hypothetical protein